jgi:membrane protease YdiL (CAAX protease family)
MLIRRSPLASFIVLAFSLCWGIGAVISGTPVLAPNGSFLIGVSIAATTIIALSGGRAALKDLLRRGFRWRVSPVWYAAVFIVPVLTTGAVLVALPLFGGTPDWTKQPSLVSVAMVFALFMVFPFATPIAEEIGWRGLALPRLLAGRSALGASLILGVIWAVWHLPVVLSDPVMRVPAPFMITVVLTSVLYTWIFLHTRGSVFIAIVFHAWSNALLAYVGAMVSGTDAALFWWLNAAASAVATILVVAIFGPGLVRGRASQPELQVSPAIA